MPLRDRPSRESQASGDRVNAAWERGVQAKIGDSDLSIGDLETLLGMLASSGLRLLELERKIAELDNKISLIST